MKGKTVVIIDKGGRRSQPKECVDESNSGLTVIQKVDGNDGYCFVPWDNINEVWWPKETASSEKATGAGTREKSTKSPAPSDG